MIRVLTKLIKAKCADCGNIFYASFEKLDHTGFVYIQKNDKGAQINDFVFCCYDCEKSFVTKLEKRYPDVKESWKPADAENMKSYPEYYEDRTCALCGSKNPLLMSHIIPKFVAQWLRETSATGYLRSGYTNERIQDSFKTNLFIVTLGKILR